MRFDWASSKIEQKEVIMSFDNFMAKVRYWDNLTARWIMRHFYIMFFQIVLVVIFFLWFVNTIQVIDITSQVNKVNLTERALSTISVNSTLIVFLILLNSFWLLFTFNSIIRIKTILRDLSYNISKLRDKSK